MPPNMDSSEDHSLMLFYRSSHLRKLYLPESVSFFQCVSFLMHSCGQLNTPQAAMDVQASQDALIDIFERIESFFQRLEIYTEVAPTTEMIDIIVKIMVEVLSILGIATKKVKKGCMSK